MQRPTRQENRMTANTKVVATRRLADGHRATLTVCPRCRQRCWTIGVVPGDCACPTERGGDR
jgi:hypothetical protein